MFWAICSDMRILASQKWPFVMGIIWVNHLVGGLEHVLLFHSVGNGMSSSQLTFIFFRGVAR